MMKKMMTVFFTVLVLFFTSEVEASLAVHPDSIIDTVSVGGNNTSILHITNLGPVSVLDYEINADVTWITFSSTSGSINMGDTVEIEIYYDISQLQSGMNYANITVVDPHHGPITIPVEIYFDGTTDVKEEFSSSNPENFSLSQNYPNPFNPSTKIVYTIPETQKVVIKIFNVLGNEIMTLADGVKSKGSYIIKLDMNGYSSGVYFYKIQTEKFTETKKMILNK